MAPELGIIVSNCNDERKRNWFYKMFTSHTVKFSGVIKINKKVVDNKSSNKQKNKIVENKNPSTGTS